LKPNNKNEKAKPKNEKSKEEYGYGYDRAVEDLSVIGQNNEQKNNKLNKLKGKHLPPFFGT